MEAEEECNVSRLPHVRSVGRPLGKRSGEAERGIEANECMVSKRTMYNDGRLRRVYSK